MLIAASSLAASAPVFPGNAHLAPKIHFTPPYVSMGGGWHDVAGAVTHNGIHHIYQGMGWNHAFSPDLIHWETGPHGPPAIHETYAGMDSNENPCSGFVTKDPEDNGRVCAGFRQCGSQKGVAGGADWDVPLELRCALDDNLTQWSTEPDYLFNVSWYRPIPYDPARPWQEADGNWYQLLSMDGCNTTTRKLPCEAGGQLVMWKSPKLRGAGAQWEKVGPVFSAADAILNGSHLTKEFVTIDFIGSMEGDPEAGKGTGTRLFLNNIGGNGGGEGCCSGTTSYFPLTQSAPGAAFKQVGPQGMVDWVVIATLKWTAQTGRSQKTTSIGKAQATGLDLLAGTGSRGLSMARTLGSEEADQVSKPGRRTLIGWTGPPDGSLKQLGGRGSAQSLPRDLSLAPDHSLLQRFSPELQALRDTHSSGSGDKLQGGLQAEVLAVFPAACATTSPPCALTLMGDSSGGSGTVVTLDHEKGLVTLDGTAQGNANVRGGPLPPAASTGGWTVHAYADHAIIELIVNNATAFVTYVEPDSAAGYYRCTDNQYTTSDRQLCMQISCAIAPGRALTPSLENAPAGAKLDVWTLETANNI